MEFLDIVDESNNLTGETAERELIHTSGIWHREVVVWVMNERGDILVQKRAANKRQHPNKWGICAGHVDAGETVEAAALRELEEELGFKATINDLEFMFIAKEQEEYPNGRKNYVFYHNYFMKTNWEVEDYKIETEELSEVKYITFEELEEVIKTQNTDFTFSDFSQAAKILEELRKRI